MKLKEEIKRVVVEYFAPITWIAKLFTKLLEKAGLRCPKCGTWGWRKTETHQELEWPSGIEGMLFPDPFPVDVTMCHCSSCNHLMFKRRKPSKQQRGGNDSLFEQMDRLFEL